MKKKIAEKWIEALRSGEYKQTKEKLCAKNGESFCCLGVLTELFIQEKNNPEKYGWIVEKDNTLEFDESYGLLSKRIQKWSGMKSDNGIYMDYYNLAQDNDNGKSFNEIAEIIEENYRRL